MSHCFSVNEPPTTPIYTLSLHDALPIFHVSRKYPAISPKNSPSVKPIIAAAIASVTVLPTARITSDNTGRPVAMELRSEEHTSELQSRFDLVCRLLLEKKKQEKGTRRSK